MFPIQNITEINPEGAKPIYVDRGADMTKLTGAFCDYVNAPVNPAPLCRFKNNSCLRTWSEHNNNYIIFWSNIFFVR
jgi:hypothetical protein